MNKSDYVFRQPFLGPRIAVDTPSGADGAQALQVMPDPAQIQVETDPLHPDAYVLALPVACDGLSQLSVCQPEAWAIFKGIDGLPRHWSEPLSLPDPAPLGGNGHLVVMAYRASIRALDHPQIKQAEVWEELNRFYTPQQLIDMVVPWSDARIKTNALCLVFGSCHYPAGLLDKRPAFASYSRLESRLANTVTGPRPQILLLLGDQIYADATAGLLDPVRADDRFEKAYQDLFGAAAVRNVLKQLPARMMLDDHEIEDNWEPTSDKGAKGQYYRPGLDAYWRYQRGTSGHTSHDFASLPVWMTFTQSGFDFFMADSRSKRAHRNPENLGLNGTLILDAPQSSALEAWLSQQQTDHGNRPKLVTSASIVLPRHTASDSDTLYLDGWDGYPESLSRLLGFMCENGIQNVIFLSGDEHMACFTDIELTRAGGSSVVRAYSIHAPALYAPLPFANARPADVRPAEVFNFESAGQHFNCSYRNQVFKVGDGFGVLTLSGSSPTASPSATWQLNLVIDGARGCTPGVMRQLS
jgi:PhoD-like phosphatase